MQFDLKLHPNKPIYKHWLLLVVIVIPFLFALYFACPLMTGLKFTLTSDGYSFFLTTFKFPLWVLSGAIVFGVIVARFHFSLQRSKSIELSEKNLQQSERNNNFKMYYEHKEVFNAFVKDIRFEIGIRQPDRKYVTCGELDIDVYKAYSYFFSNNSPTNMHADFTISDINNSFSKITPENSKASCNDGRAKDYIKFTGTPFIFSFIDLRKYWPDIMKTGELKEIELLLIHSVYKVSMLIFEGFSSVPNEDIFMNEVEKLVDEKYHALIGLDEDMTGVPVFISNDIHFILEQIKA